MAICGLTGDVSEQCVLCGCYIIKRLLKYFTISGVFFLVISMRNSGSLCGAVRCGAVRCGAVRCGAVRCGAVRCGAVRGGAGRGGAVLCGVLILVFATSAVDLMRLQGIKRDIGADWSGRCVICRGHRIVIFQIPKYG